MQSILKTKMSMNQSEANLDIVILYTQGPHLIRLISTQSVESLRNILLKFEATLSLEKKRFPVDPFAKTD